MQQQENVERTPPPRSLTVKEVADRMGVSNITVYRHLRSGKLPYFKFGGSIRVLEHDLDTFIQVEKRRSMARVQAVRSRAAPVTTAAKVTAWWDTLRPSSWTASAIPVLLAGSIAGIAGKFDILLFLLSLLGTVLLQAGTNVINELFDARQQENTSDSNKSARMPAQNRLQSSESYRIGLLLFGLATLTGAYLVTVRGYPVIVFGAVAVVLGYSYTAPPLQLKYRALGVPVVFLVMGPLVVLGTYYVLTAEITSQAALASLPVGLLVAAIPLANDVRDADSDRKGGSTTIATVAGERVAARVYSVITLAAYGLVLAFVSVDFLPLWCLLALAALPLSIRAVLTTERSPSEGTSRVEKVSTGTAQAHMLFGLLLSLGFLLQGIPG